VYHYPQLKLSVWGVVTVLTLPWFHQSYPDLLLPLLYRQTLASNGEFDLSSKTRMSTVLVSHMILSLFDSHLSFPFTTYVWIIRIISYDYLSKSFDWVLVSPITVSLSQHFSAL